jgi:AsmA protein
MSGLNQGGSSQGGGRPGSQRSIPGRTSPAEASTEPTQDASAAEPIPPAPPGDTTAQQDSQPMNDVLRQLFNR